MNNTNIMNITKDKTLIILDWDDTLFPTTWITTNNINIKNGITNRNIINYFNLVDKELYKLLSKLMSYGTVIIITNAMLNWISISVTLLDQTSSLLRLNKESTAPILVISAREAYGTNPDPNEWKKKTFIDVVQQYYNDKNNIVSIGDAEYEYIALINLHVKTRHNYRLLKSVKFIKYPTRDLLLDQIKVMTKASKQVCLKPTHLDLKFDTK
jgi:hypothetical protein